jgi:hypothetical protein
MSRILLPFLLAATLLIPQVAAAATRLVAVLPLNAVNKKVAPDDRETLEETIRTIAGDALVPGGFTVLTGETTLAVLSENGIDANKACEASCSLQAARELKAELFIAGSVTLSEGNYIAFVRLFDVGGKQLASVKLEGAKIRDLRQQFEEKSPTFFGKVLGNDSKPATTTVAKTEPKKEESRIETTVKEVFRKEEPPRANETNGVMVQFEPPTSTARWSLFRGENEKLCDLPCKQVVGPNSGFTLRPADDSRPVKIQDDLDVPLGRAYLARARLPSKMFLLKPGWLGASIPSAAVFSLTGLTLLLVGSVSSSTDGYTSSYDDSSTSSSDSYYASGFICLGLGAAAVVWTIYIFKNMRVNGVVLTPLEVAQHQFDAPTYAMALRSQPVARPIR